MQELMLCPRKDDYPVLVWHLEPIGSVVFELLVFNSIWPENGLRVFPSNVSDSQEVGISGISDY